MKRFFLSILLAAAGFCLSAQSAQKITELIATEKANYGNASWLIAVQTGLAQDTNTDAETFEILVENDYISQKPSATGERLIPSAEDEIKIKDFASLCLRAYKIKGGLMYRITKSPRYALRELKAMKVVSNDADPNTIVSGKQMIHILNTCRYTKEASK